MSIIVDNPEAVSEPITENQELTTEEVTEVEAHLKLRSKLMKYLRSMLVRH